MPEDNDQVRAIAKEVETYLAQHPEAVDSAEGIVRWWLSRLRLEEAVANVARALDLLVEEGIVVRRQMPDGRYVYGKATRHNE
jgi:Fe2+ or Zn2+ uptake regulation protein